MSDTQNNTPPEINWNTVDAVLFDLDGTLVDSMWMWKAIDVEFLKRYGYDCPEDLEKVIEGMSLFRVQQSILKIASSCR